MALLVWPPRVSAHLVESEGTTPCLLASMRADKVARDVCPRQQSIAEPPMDPESPVAIPSDSERRDRASYAQILRSTTIMGGSSIVNILFGIARSKVLAVLLGPAGVGLMGIYASILSTASTIAGMGLSGSGVRQIAEAQGTGDARVLDDVRFALRWATRLLGGAGALGLYLLRHQVSNWTTGDDSLAQGVSVLAIGVFFSVLSGSQTALLNGLRRISDLARIHILGAVLGTAVAIACVWFLRERGVVFTILAISLTTFIASWWYSSRIPRVSGHPPFREFLGHVLSLWRLGVAFMLSALMTTGALLLTRIIIVQRLGLEASGLFQASWSITMLYMGFVLQAMGSDFYPRLTALIRDRAASNKLVNEQTEVALLLTGPVLLGVLTFAPLMIRLLYSAAFAESALILRWQVFGNFFKVITWPMGFIIVAKGMGRVFIASELFWNASYVGIIWFGTRPFGLPVAGTGFVLAYALYAVLVYAIVAKVNGFRWETRNLVLALSLLAAALVVMPLSWCCPTLSHVVGALASLGCAAYACRCLRPAISTRAIERVTQRVRAKLHAKGGVTRG